MRCTLKSLIENTERNLCNHHSKVVWQCWASFISAQPLDKGVCLRFYSTSVKGSKSSRVLKDAQGKHSQGYFFLSFFLLTMDAYSITVEPQRSLLHPPKPPSSVWQIYFSDWLQCLRCYNKSDQKLNVAQEAKEAAIAYNKLSDDEKEARVSPSTLPPNCVVLIFMI